MIKNIKTSITGITSVPVASVAAGHVGVIFSMAFCNTGTVETKLSINLGASHALVSAVTLPAGETFIYSTKTCSKCFRSNKCYCIYSYSSFCYC